MSRHGENIYKRKDNRFEGRYIKGYDQSGKAKFGYVYAKTYKEVKEKLIKIKANPQRQISNNKKSVDIFCDEWLKLKRSRVKESNGQEKILFGMRLPSAFSISPIP